MWKKHLDLELQTNNILLQYVDLMCIFFMLCWSWGLFANMFFHIFTNLHLCLSISKFGKKSSLSLFKTNIMSFWFQYTLRSFISRNYCTLPGHSHGMVFNPNIIIWYPLWIFTRHISLTMRTNLIINFPKFPLKGITGRLCLNNQNQFDHIFPQIPFKRQYRKTERWCIGGTIAEIPHVIEKKWDKFAIKLST